MPASSQPAAAGAPVRPRTATPGDAVPGCTRRAGTPPREPADVAVGPPVTGAPPAPTPAPARPGRPKVDAVTRRIGELRPLPAEGDRPWPTHPDPRARGAAASSGCSTGATGRDRRGRSPGHARRAVHAEPGPATRNAGCTRRAAGLDDWFVQALEARSTRCGQLFDRIAQDPRHEQVQLLDARPVRRRLRPVGDGAGLRRRVPGHPAHRAHRRDLPGGGIADHPGAGLPCWTDDARRAPLLPPHPPDLSHHSSRRRGAAGGAQR